MLFIMRYLTDMPSEILRLILEALADIHLISLFAAARTCKVFHTIITDITYKTMSSHGRSIHAFMMAHFSSILESASVPTWYAAFYALPWASDERVRTKYCREDASWRKIPLASANGRIIERLETIVQSQYYQDEIFGIKGGYVGWGSDAEGRPENYHFPKGISLGMLYDLLLSSGHGRLSGGWELLFESRVSDAEAFESLRMDLATDRVRRQRGADIDALLTQAKDSALLLFIGRPNRGLHLSASGTWEPAIMGDGSIACSDFSCATNGSSTSSASVCQPYR